MLVIHGLVLELSTECAADECSASSLACECKLLYCPVMTCAVEWVILGLQPLTLTNDSFACNKFIFKTVYCSCF